MSVQRKVAFSFTNMLYLFIKKCMIMEKSTQLSQDHHLTPGTEISGKEIQQFLAGGQVSGRHTAPTCLGAVVASPFMSTWFSNRSSDRVTQRTSMLESTSELLICFRNTWNWSRDGTHWLGLLARGH